MTEADNHRCEALYDDDGTQVAVARVAPDISDTERAALVEVVAAARRRFQADVQADPTILTRQAAARARVAERNRRLRSQDGSS